MAVQIITKEFLDSLEHAWSADIEMPNGTICKIWWTAWPMAKARTKNIISVSSDYSKGRLCYDFLIQ
jgi:hypothetical protein